jgi:nitroreductase
MSTYEFLAQRRSAAVLIEPKPNRSEIEKILQVAGTVPDHGVLRPYRFVVVEGEGRDRFGEALVNAANENRGAPLDESVKPKIKAKAFAAPLQILIIFSPQESGKIPDWEQMASACCSGYAIDLAANALGFGAVWKSFAYDPGSQLKDLLKLGHREKFLGWVNIGTEKNRGSMERESLDLAKHALFIS